MFEDRTYENIMAECLEAAPEGVDLRQGSIFYDAVASASIKIAQFYADIRTAFDLVFLTSAVGEYLDRKGFEFRVVRLSATPATYEYNWTGEEAPAPGNRFFANELFFTLRQNDDMSLYLEAEIPGIVGNNILSGTNAIPVNNISGLATSVFGALIEPGVDSETDDNYRERIMEKISGSAENGNRQHYETWCESVPGVGRARIIPLFAGPNTVMGVIIGADGLYASQAVVDRVQEYIDPITLGLTVNAWGETIPIGDGLGDGVANIGAHFAAVAPVPVSINLNFSAELKSGTTIQQIIAEVEVTLEKFLKDLVLSSANVPIVIRMSAISSMLYSVNGLVDYSGLTMNGGTANITLSNMQTAIPGEVTADVIV